MKAQNSKGQGGEPNKNKDGIAWSRLGNAPLINSEAAPNFKALLKQASENLTPVVLNFGTVNYLAVIAEVHDDYFTWIYAKEKDVLFKSANKYSELIQVIFAATDWTQTTSIPVTGIQALYLLQKAMEDMDLEDNDDNDDNDEETIDRDELHPDKHKHDRINTGDTYSALDTDIFLLNDEISMQNYWDYFSEPPPAEEDDSGEDQDVV